jgi:hypothetical protein
MPTNDMTISELLGYVPLTEPVKKIVASLPRVLPEPFYNNTKPVLGDRYKRITERPTRKVARTAPYGSPPRTVKRTGIGVEEIVMIHSIEEITAGPEVLRAFHAYDALGTPVLNAANELARQGEDFARRSENLRTTAVHSLVAFGKMWFDADGNIQTTFSGSDLEIDFRIPASNKTAFPTSWADPNADIPSMILNLQTESVMKTGRVLKYAIYTKNVAGYLANNDKFKQYLTRTYGTDGAAFKDTYIRTGTIPDGVLDLIWVKAQDAHFETDAGSIQEVFPVDQVSFFPELSDTLVMREGSMTVPKEFGMVGQVADFNAALKMLANNPVYGMFRFAYGTGVPLPKVSIVQGDTFFPDLLVPEAVFIKDTTP